MRQGPNARRSRGRGGNNNNRRQNVPLRHQTFDSNGPDVRIRGNAYQVHEKYLALARDATSAGDRVAAENYLQHAEHYFRIISTFADAPQGNEGQQPQPQQPPQPQQQHQRGRNPRDAGSGSGAGSGSSHGQGFQGPAQNGADDGDDGDDDGVEPMVVTTRPGYGPQP